MVGLKGTKPFLVAWLSKQSSIAPFDTKKSRPERSDTYLADDKRGKRRHSLPWQQSRLGGRFR